MYRAYMRIKIFRQRRKWTFAEGSTKVYFSPMILPNKLAIVDTETTGGSFYHDRIIEIGILIVENGKLVKTYQTLINPERYIPSFISTITGIYEQDVEKAPTFLQIKDELWDILKEAIFVAHNASFDKGFLKAEFARSGLSFQPKTLCTVRLSRKFFPEYSRHNLDEIIHRFNLPCDRRHRALDDAKVLYDFLEIIKSRFTSEEITKNINPLLKAAPIPPTLNPKEIEELPENHGVYIFYDSKDAPLYIGKSINIKKRVQSHFSASSRETKEMKIFQNVARIETMVTPGELGALLLESEMIKKLLPIHNRRLRKTRHIVILKKYKRKMAMTR